MGGRRAHYTTRVAKRICEHIALGATVREALEMEPLAPSVPLFWRWLDEFPEFLMMYERARQLQTDLLADEILVMARNVLKDPKNAPAYRVSSDILKWHAEIKHPERYGTRAPIEQKRTLDPAKIRAEIKALEKELGMAQQQGAVVEVPMKEIKNV